MGVLGLWKLLDAAGKPVPVETLEGKVLAIDISIWIHQVIQGYQDRRGNMLPNAHLIGLFNRLCKLMYFKIKPVVVFDGGVPLLKKNTIAARRKLKSAAISKAEKLKNDLISNLIKHSVVKGALVKGNENTNKSPLKNSIVAVPSTSNADDMYKLPDIPSTSKVYDSDEELMPDDNELSPRKQTKWMGNIHSVDVNTEEFKNLPADVRYDILNDLKETRKQNSWAKVQEMPAGTHDYSGFQVKRLLKRRLVQESLEKAEKEMGGKTFTLDELDKLLTEQGISTTLQDDAYRIASDSTTRVVYINELADSKKKDDKKDDFSKAKLVPSIDDTSDSNSSMMDSSEITINDSQYDINNLSEYDVDEFWGSDEDFNQSNINQTNVKPNMNPAMNYMLEYSGLTPHQILKLIEQNKKEKEKSNNLKSKNKKRKTALSKNLKQEQKPNKTLKFDVEEESSKVEKIDSGIISINESSSDSEEFVEVSNENKIDLDKTVTKESSESDSDDDFVVINDVPIPELTETKQHVSPGIQITVKPEEDMDDDIFADVFCNDVKHNSNVANKIDEINKEVDIEINKEISPIKKNDSNFLTDDSNLSLIDKSKNNVRHFRAEITSDFETLNENSSHSENIQSSSEKIEEKLINLDQEKVENAKNVELKEMSDEYKTKQKSILNSQESDQKFVSLYQQNLEKNEETNIEEVLQNKPEIVFEAKSQVEPINLPVDEQELESMKKDLEMEQRDITGMLGKLERQAVDITDQMRIEAQELLKLFGIPYIIAPMEAEAQCAYLEQIKLTEGTITDDSDIWLFGGNCVYKHFFDNNKRVLQFLAQDIQHHFKLSRKEMIQLAILVGSDYTNGLMGVGPVTALEIMATFPSHGEDILCGLRNFSSWLKLGKLSAPEKNTLRNKLKNVQIEKGFPSQAVVQAYLNPALDESKEDFTWGQPNLVLLADYTRQKFGWTKLKFEEIMNPVMKKFNERKSQSTINSYFKVQSIPKSIECNLSKRVQNALHKIGGTEEASGSNVKSKTKRTKKTNLKEAKSDTDESNNLVAEPSIIENNEVSSEEAITSKNKEIQKPKKKLIITSTPEVDEVIPQREKDKINALKAKLKAIEVYRKSKKGLGHTKKAKKVVRPIKKDADLSESDSS